MPTQLSSHQDRPASTQAHSMVGGSAVPFLRIIIPAVVGIVLAWWFDVWWIVLACCFFAASLMAILLRGGRYTGVYIWLSVFLFFFMIAELREPRSKLPMGERVVLAVQIDEKPHTRGRWQHTTATVGYYQLESSEESRVEIDERVVLMIDSCYHDIEVGSQLLFRGWLNPIDTTGSGYGKLMRIRGLHARIYLVEGGLLSRLESSSHTLSYYASKMQQRAIERLNRLHLDPDSQGVVTAMTVGDKRGVSGSLRQGYSLTGAAHLLAVSGLHVGIVFVLINLLLYFLPAFRAGHIWKSVVAIIAIWLYSMMAGLAPSVIRSALMFSFAQVALASSSSRSGLNIMLGSAVVMLAINPNYATDPSFLLSYVAVLSLILFCGPLYRRLRTKNRYLNALISILIVGFVASVGTAPLVSYWFGNFPIVGMLINPVVIVTAHIIVMVGVLWVLLPFSFWEPLFSWILSFAAGIQNRVVEWSAELWWSSVRFDLPLWGVLIIYGCYIVIAIGVHRWDINRRKESIFAKQT